jgi:hypothetical protein
VIAGSRNLGEGCRRRSVYGLPQQQVSEVKHAVSRAQTRTETGQRRLRRVRLTPMRPVPVEFTGKRSGEGPLTLGQLNMYIWLSRIPDHPYGILCAELPVPSRVSVDDAAKATAMLIARHESLRTTYVPGERPRQRVAAAGVKLLEVCSLGEGQWGPRDRPAVAEALVRWLRESPDPGRRPVRVAVAIAPDAGDRVIACAAAFTHLAVDNGAIGILRRDFASRLTRPSWRPHQTSGAGLRRHWTTSGRIRGVSPAACTLCRAPGPAASRWRSRCHRQPPRWPYDMWQAAPGPAGPASCLRPSAP